MRKIIEIGSRIETCGEVKDALAAAAEMGFVEIMVVGKGKNGDYYLRKSDHKSSLEFVGVLEMAKQWLLEQMGEE